MVALSAAVINFRNDGVARLDFGECWQLSATHQANQFIS